MSSKRRMAWRKRRVPERHVSLIVSATLAVSSATSYSQTQASAPSRIIEEGLRRQQERELRQEQSLNSRPDVLSADGATSVSAELPDELPCFPISEIAFDGESWRRFSWLTAKTAPYLNHCVGVEGLNVIVRSLDAALVDQGYVTTRVAIPPQSLKDGRLKLLLQVGGIAEIRMVRQAKGRTVADDEWGTWKNSFPVSPGDRLDVRAVEQGVEQMKRLPSQRVSTTIEPAGEPDMSVLVIERQTGGWKDRLRGGVTIDNSGSRSQGRTQIAANFALDNPLGLSDVVSVSANGNAENPGPAHRSQSIGFNYAIPFGYSSLSASLSHSRFAQNIQLTTTSVRSSGESDNSQLKWDHIAWRTASTKTGIFAGLSTRKAQSYLDDVELVTQHRRTTFVETGLNFKQLFANGAAADFSLAYRRGVSWLNAQEDLPVEASVTLRPSLWAIDAGLSIPLTLPVIAKVPSRDVQYRVDFHWQSTNDRVTTIDQIAIGSRSSVHGFDGNAVLIAENGWTLRNDISTPLAWIGADAALYLGVDCGRVWGPSDTLLTGNTLAGVALGFRGRWQSIQFDLSLATPILMPPGFRTDRLNPYASATWAF